MEINMIAGARIAVPTSWTPAVAGAVHATVAAAVVAAPRPRAVVTVVPSPVLTPARERGIAYLAPDQQGRSVSILSADKRVATDLVCGVPPRSRPA